MTNCADLAPLLSNFSLVESCDTVRDGSLRLSTPFRYPDGSQIDVFLSEPLQSQLMYDFVLSDKGNTTAYLLDLNVRFWTTKRRKQAIDDVCEALGITLRGGQLEIALKASELATQLPNSVVRLAQACVRMADLAFTQRLRAVNSFKEDVEEFLDTSALKYESPALIPSRFADKTLEIDFRVFGERSRSLVQAVSTGASPMAHTVMNEIFRRWFDVPDDVRSSEQLVTIYDSSQNNYREDDLERLATQSLVLAYPDQSSQIRDLLAA